jgi:predicted lipoprotein
MPLTLKQFLQIAYRRIMLAEAEQPISEAKVDSFLEAIPMRLPQENYVDWIKRGQKMAQVMPFPDMKFKFLTDVQRLAADSRDTEDALPEIPLMSANQQFRFTVDSLPDNKLKLTLEALGSASNTYANRLIGIAAADSKDQLISLIRLDADGDGFDDSLDNTAAVRQALLRPVIALVEQA